MRKAVGSSLERKRINCDSGGRRPTTAPNNGEAAFNFWQNNVDLANGRSCRWKSPAGFDLVTASSRVGEEPKGVTVTLVAVIVALAVAMCWCRCW